MAAYPPPVPPEPMSTAFAPAPPPDLGHRVGRILIVPRKAALPFRCIKCGGPAEGKPLKRVLYWHSPLIYLTILAGLLIYVVLALVLRQTAAYHVGLCRAHRARRRWGILLGWLSVPAGLGMAALAIDQEDPVLGVAAFVVFVGLIIAGALIARVIWPSRIDERFAWIKGAGEGYLSAFPGS